MAGRQAPLLVRDGPDALAPLVMFGGPEGRARLFVEPREGHLPVAFRGGLALVVEHRVGRSGAGVGARLAVPLIFRGGGTLVSLAPLTFVDEV